MTKVIEVTHFLTERFSLTEDEPISTLRAKYGDEPIFSDGQIDMVTHQKLLEPTDEIHIYFKVDQA
ncbi:hypothetical protein SAMN05660489_03705 [Pseudomonas sp. LAMO17WK12:I10]|nr:hypothetical protein H160_03919 [Pseudomonas sp. LAMO17WK12:I9]SNY39965.1 hypothetical protein SAMN05660489_03705 [Pseudomonas sp. LAMO17WK12:I10]